MVTKVSRVLWQRVLSVLLLAKSVCRVVTQAKTRRLPRWILILCSGPGFCDLQWHGRSVSADSQSMRSEISLPNYLRIKLTSQCNSQTFWMPSDWIADSSPDSSPPNLSFAFPSPSSWFPSSYAGETQRALSFFLHCRNWPSLPISQECLPLGDLASNESKHRELLQISWSALWFYSLVLSTTFWNPCRVV